MKPPIFWRLVNDLRAWWEDRRVPECSYLDQMRRLWAREEPRKVVSIRARVMPRRQPRRANVA